MLFLSIFLFSLLAFMVCACVAVLLIVELQERRRAALHAQPRPRRMFRLRLLQGGKPAVQPQPPATAETPEDAPESRIA